MDSSSDQNLAVVVIGAHSLNMDMDISDEYTLNAPDTSSPLTLYICELVETLAVSLTDNRELRSDASDSGPEIPGGRRNKRALSFIVKVLRGFPKTPTESIRTSANSTTSYIPLFIVLQVSIQELYIHLTLIRVSRCARLFWILFGNALMNKT